MGLLLTYFAFSSVGDEFDWRAAYEAMSPAEQEGFHDDGSTMSRHDWIKMLEGLRETLYPPLTDAELMEYAEAVCDGCGPRSARSYFEFEKQLTTDGRESLNDQIRNVLYDYDGSWREAQLQNPKHNQRTTKAQAWNKIRVAEARGHAAKRRVVNNLRREVEALTEALKQQSLQAD